MSDLEFEEGSNSLQSSGLKMPPPQKRMKQMKLQFSISTDNSACSNTGQICDSTFNSENFNNPINDVQHDPSCCTSECCLGCLTLFQTTDPNILSKLRKKDRVIGIETFLLPGVKPFHGCHYAGFLRARWMK